MQDRWAGEREDSDYWRIWKEVIKSYGTFKLDGVLREKAKNDHIKVWSLLLVIHGDVFRRSKANIIIEWARVVNGRTGEWFWACRNSLSSWNSRYKFSLYKKCLFEIPRNSLLE